MKQSGAALTSFKFHLVTEELQPWMPWWGNSASNVVGQSWESLCDPGDPLVLSFIIERRVDTR